MPTEMAYSTVATINPRTSVNTRATTGRHQRQAGVRQNIT